MVSVSRVDAAYLHIHLHSSKYEREYTLTFLLSSVLKTINHLDINEEMIFCGFLIAFAFRIF
jgi:hypothetical protein